MQAPSWEQKAAAKFEFYADGGRHVAALSSGQLCAHLNVSHLISKTLRTTLSHLRTTECDVPFAKRFSSLFLSPPHMRCPPSLHRGQMTTRNPCAYISHIVRNRSQERYLTVLIMILSLYSSRIITQSISIYFQTFRRFVSAMEMSRTL